MRRRALRNFNEIRANFRPAQILQNEPETPSRATAGAVSR